MIALTLAEVAAATGGRLAGGADPATVVTGSVEFDSRQVGAGGLFVALPGERVDGHDFASAAMRSGAVGVLAACEAGVPAVLLDDVLAGLGLLARCVVDRLPATTVIGLTGSSGKTTTKDLIAHLLEPTGQTVAAPGSFNNAIGFPWTVLRAAESTRFLVLEEGARAVGHIAALCRIAPPRIGAVLNVGTAHVGEFGSQAAIATAKGELIEALPAAADGGIAVLNADDPLVAAMAERTRARVVRTGTGADADVRATDVGVDAQGRAGFTLVVGGERHPVRLGLTGAHQVANALAAAAVALAVGAAPAEVAARLGSARPVSRWRMEVTERADGVTVVNDAYNANPESVRAALATLATMTAGVGQRAWAVLGPMAELGDRADDEHAAIGGRVVELGIDRLIVVGAAASVVLDGAVRVGIARDRSVQVPDIAAAVALLAPQLRAGDVVLVKASRVAGLERLAQALLDGPPVDDGVPDPSAHDSRPHDVGLRERSVSP